jgi:hypothetical protein
MTHAFISNKDQFDADNEFVAKNKPDHLVASLPRTTCLCLDSNWEIKLNKIIFSGYLWEEFKQRRGL